MKLIVSRFSHCVVESQIIVHFRLLLMLVAGWMGLVCNPSLHALDVSLLPGFSYVQAAAMDPVPLVEYGFPGSWNDSGVVASVNGSSTVNVNWALMDSGAQASFSMNSSMMLSPTREAFSLGYVRFILNEPVKYKISGDIMTSGVSIQNQARHMFHLRRFVAGVEETVATESDEFDGFGTERFDGVEVGAGFLHGSRTGYLLPGDYDFIASAGVFNEPIGHLAGESNVRLTLTRWSVPDASPGCGPLVLLSGLWFLLARASRQESLHA